MEFLYGLHQAQILTYFITTYEGFQKTKQMKCPFNIIFF